MEETELNVIDTIQMNKAGQLVNISVTQLDERNIKKIKKRCAVPGCENEINVKNKELSFFVFPRDFKRRKEWLLNISRADLIDKKYEDLGGEKICAQHFEKKYLNHMGNRIYMDAVPTLNLPNKVIKIITKRNSEEWSNISSTIVSDFMKQEAITISDAEEKSSDPYVNMQFEFVTVKTQDEMEPEAEGTALANKENKAVENSGEVSKLCKPNGRSNRKVLFCLKDNSGLNTGIVIIPKHMDLESSCRTCLATKHLQSIFSVANGGDETISSYADMLESCMNIPVSLTDDLPKKICANCAQEISRLYHFIAICRQSQRTVACYIKYNETIRRQQDDTPKPPDIDQLMASWAHEKKSLTRLIGVEHNYMQAEVGERPLAEMVKDDEILSMPVGEVDRTLIVPDVEDGGTRTVAKVRRARGGAKQSSAEIKMFPCKACPKKFYTKAGRTRHLRAEHGDLVATNEAKKTTTTTTTTTTSTDDGGVCEQCGKQFPTRSGLKTHRKTHEARQWLCNHCGKLFVCSQALDRHVRSHTGDLRHACTVCDARCMTRSLLTVHMRKHTGERPFLCTLCGRGFMRRSALRTHEFRHAGVKPYACPACNRRFVTSSNRVQHQRFCRGRIEDEDELGRGERVGGGRGRIFTVESPAIPQHRCPFERCRTARLASFPREDLLDAHILEVHARDGDEDVLTEPRLVPWRCPVCRQEFEELDECAAHERDDHAATRIYRCEEDGCDHVALSLYTWRLHATRSHIPRPYACSQCDKRFTKACGLYTHRKLHRSDEDRFRYRCERCNRRFAQPQQLRYHERTHTGERPHACPLCGKRFALNGNLTVHMRRHRGERPYMCAHCDHVGFYDSSHLRKHMRKVHPDKPLFSAVASILP